MAAAEYYATAHELPGTHPPQVYSAQAQPPPPQYQQPYAQRPPQYKTSPHQQQIQTYPPHPHNAHPTPPYPTDPAPYFAPPPHSTTHLGAPLRPHRSRSQPPRVHFADQDSDRSLSDSYSDSDSSSSSPRRRHRHHSSRDLDSGHRHHHSNSRDLTHAQRREHKDRDTFLGAGAGALVGDVIFPGLGTAAGILLGGLGGRKYARRSRSEDGHRHRDAYREGKEEARQDGHGHGHGHKHRDAYYEGKEEARHERDGERKKRHRRSDGWDEESGTYKSGLVVR